MAIVSAYTVQDKNQRIDYNKLTTYEIVDAVLKYFETHEDKGLPFPLFNHCEALDYLDEFDLIRYKGGSRQNIAYITPNGRQVAAKGFSVFMQEQAQKARFDAERQKLSDQKLKNDYKTSTRVVKTYWWTFFFAVVSFAYVIFQVVVKLIEHFKDK